MVSGISASGAVSAAFARFDRAAGAVVAAASGDGGADAGDIAGAIVEMDASQIAIAACLMVLRQSNDMLANALNLGGYGTSIDEAIR